MSSIQVQVFLSEAVFEELKERSKLEGVPYSELIEIALMEYFDAIESELDEVLYNPSPSEPDPSKH